MTRIARVNERSLSIGSSPFGLGGTTAQPALNDLSDVDLGGIADGDTIVWDDGTDTWVPGTPGGSSSMPWYDVVIDGGLVGDGVTDDTVALQAAIDAATTSGTCSATLYFPPGVYLIGGALQDTGAFNGQILLPDVDIADPQITIKFLGAARPPFAFHGTDPDAACYSIIKSTLTGASGTAACISGGNSGQNNIEVVVEDLICEAPNNPTFTFWNLSTTQGGKRDGLFITTVGLWTLAFTEPSNSNAYGIKLPQTNNSDLSVEDVIMVVNFYTGILHGELVDARYIMSLCQVGVEIPFMYHPGGHIKMVQTSCPIGIFATGGDSYLDIWYDAEHCNVGAGGPINPAWAVQVDDVEDPSDFIHGHIRWFGVQAGVGPDHIFTLNGGANILYEEIGEPPAGSGGGTPAATVTDETTFGITPAVGTDTEYARQDHTHGSPSTSAISDAGRWEVLMVPGVTSPPDPVQTIAGDDWLYGWVPG